MTARADDRALLRPTLPRAPGATCKPEAVR